MENGYTATVHFLSMWNTSPFKNLDKIFLSFRKFDGLTQKWCSFPKSSNPNFGKCLFLFSKNSFRKAKFLLVFSSNCPRHIKYKQVKLKALLHCFIANMKQKSRQVLPVDADCVLVFICCFNHTKERLRVKKQMWRCLKHTNKGLKSQTKFYCKVNVVKKHETWMLVGSFLSSPVLESHCALPHKPLRKPQR